ncbi:MAG: 23S rRNA (adenine(2503)-C(2))-methyltransferase RlmN [Bacteroides sp.]|nr:23S rRNA (adenine(2503)-C(2))-methyltransferase RlmN [Eubacterium sp.]MCM1417944.1 23S rRNA (adenine(2503)-C(2))-methyltransferase RlmN [Roseburia sp.]MCM1461809.1 23S rRNA (adenine(2503)-C(2))-methyltransferase RlmN [Bacteroides sp.]
MKQDLLSLSLPELEAALLALGEKKFRARQLYEWLHKKNAVDLAECTNLSAALRERLGERFFIPRLTILKKLESRLDGTIKYLYALPDGERVETVLMSYHHGDSLCISTQVGCKMGCSFCASTKAGFVRDLTPSEILLQLYETERDSGRSVGSIVLMGIGEPLDNFDNVMKFLDLLSSEAGRGMSLRHVSLSTCGLVEEIDRLADKKLGLTLSVSLHAPTDEKRSAVMPVNRRYGVGALVAACKRYFDKTGRRVSFEFALIEGVNDDRATAEELIRLLKPLAPCHVNLIPVNEIRERDYRRSANAKAFQTILTEGGLNATIRRTLGADISAACGQLRRDYVEEKNG